MRIGILIISCKARLKSKPQSDKCEVVRSSGLGATALPFNACGVGLMSYLVHLSLALISKPKNKNVRWTWVSW